MGVLLVIIVVCGLVAGMTVVNGLLLHLMWGWFMVPLGLPVISVAHALGIALVVSLLTHQTNTKKGEDKDLGEVVIAWIFTCLLTLLMGVIFHSMM